MEKVKMNDDQLDQVTGGSFIPHVVGDGETLQDLAKKNNMSVEQLLAFNGMTDESQFKTGLQLKIPF